MSPSTIDRDMRLAGAASVIAPELRAKMDADRAAAEKSAVRPRELSAYCSYCKGRIAGPDVGYRDPMVSHGVCKVCLPMVRSGMLVRTIQEVREVELKVQLEALRKELGKSA